MKGLVLSGGKSRRFGEDKALAFWGEATLLETAVGLLESLGLEPAVVTRAGADYSFLECPVLLDSLPDKGPLGGLWTAMTYFENTTFLVLTCDMPALTIPALRTLLEQHEPSRGLTFYSTASKGEQPFPGIYEPSLFPIIEKKIGAEKLSMKGLLEAVPSRKLVFWEGDPAVFSNVNSKADLHAIL